MYVFFFFKQKTAYEMRISDWSSDVCSSDLHEEGALRAAFRQQVEKGCGVALHPARLAVPILARHGAGEGVDLVIILHVDGEGVALCDHTRGAPGRRRIDRKSTRLNSSH